MSNRQRCAGDRITRPELMFGVSTISHANEEFSGLALHVAVQPDRLPHMRVTPLIERAPQSNPW
jgi:hypothetical protein